MEKHFASLRQLDHHGLESIRIYPNREPDDYPAHWHMKYEIILPAEESYAADVDSRRYEVLPGQVLIIPSGVVHEIFAPENGLRYIIMVDHEVINATEGLGGMQHLFYPCAHLRPGLDISESAVEYLRQAIREHENPGPLAQAAVTAWVRLFLIQASRALFHSSAENQGEHRHQMSGNFLDIYAYITEHCSEKLTLESVAAYSGYSKYHFSRIFKEYTGMSFYDFYLRQRLILCRQLLSEMTLPITEVASRSGFGSLATFNRVFKQYEGVTPTQYRQLWQQRRTRVPHEEPIAER
ncbi:MAG: helix-turn-helix transcriptional regulator [Clostridia bacterium]|nr:helix-turn-helix transcriptional regulator [Clostridia bacterium]